MLQVQNLSKSYGATGIIKSAGFIINDGEHVGLIGPNGSGKSTLLRCVTGHEQPDSGTVVLSPRGATIGYLPQAFSEDGDRPIGEVVAAANIELAQADEELQLAAEALTTVSQDMAGAMLAYTEALARFEALGGYEREHRA